MPAKNLERLPGGDPLRVDASSWAGARASGAAGLDHGLLTGASVIVDALLGTGFRGEVRERVG